MFRVLDPLCAVLVPYGQHTAHGHIHVAAGFFVHGYSLLEHGDDLFVHLDRSDAGLVIDRL